MLRRLAQDYLGVVVALRQAHGDLTFMRLGWERAYDVFDPALVRAALVDQASHLIRWERGIEVFAQSFGQSVLVSEAATWQRQRRMLTPGFSPRQVQACARLMTAAAGEALDAAIPPGQDEAEVDAGALMTRTTMDVILRTLFGEPDRGDCVDVARATQILSHRAMREMFWPMTLPDGLPLPGKRAKRQALRTLHGLVARRIEQRRQRSPDTSAPDDLLAMLLAVRDADTGLGLSPAEVHDQCMVMFQAGHETSATGLTWWAWLMATHPAAQAQAREELRRVLGERDPTGADLPALDWLGATLKEALRLYPPIGALMTRRVVTPLQLGGWTVPAGALLRITPAAIHRDPRWFSEPQAFRPERFVAGAAPPPRGAWMPFGVGPRVCIGQHFALLEMTLVAARLLQCHELGPVPGDAPPEPAFDVTLRPRLPLRLRLRRVADAPGLRRPGPAPARTRPALAPRP